MAAADFGYGATNSITDVTSDLQISGVIQVKDAFVFPGELTMPPLWFFVSILGSAVLGYYLYVSDPNPSSDPFALVVGTIILAIIANAVIFPFRIFKKYQEKQAAKAEEEFMRLSPEDQRERLIELRQQALTNWHRYLADAEQRGDPRGIAECRGKIAYLESELRRLGA